MLLNNLLKYKPTLFFLLLIGPLAYAQGVPQAGITSTPTDSDGSVSICFNGAISFTGFGGSLHFTPRSYSFFVIRSGQVTPVLLRERNDTAVWYTTGGTTSNTIQNGDQVFVRAWNNTTASANTVPATFSDSRRITVTVNEAPAPTLTNDAVNNTFCTGQAVTFGVLPVSGGGNTYNYRFYINDVLMQGPSSDDTYGPITTLNDGDEVRVEVINTVTSCTGSSSLLMHENIVDGGGSIAFDVASDNLNPQSICNGTTPPNIISTLAGTVSGTMLPANSTSYQWYSSLDATNWEIIPNANGQNYQPPVLTATTYYRRNTINIFNGQLCDALSKILQVWVAPNLVGGTVSGTTQTICENEIPQGIMISGGVTGTTVTYRWQISTDRLNFVDIAQNAISENYQPGALTQTSYFRRVTSALSGQCSVTSTIHTINVINRDVGEFDPALNETICYNNAPTRIFSDDTYLVGMALKHINRPNISYNKEQNQSLPISIVLNGGYEYDINPYERNILPRYSFLFTYGSLTKYDSSYYLFLSQELQLGEFSLGISQQASKVKSINLNNIGLSVGLSLENFDFGVLYNVGIRNVTQVFAPSVFELYLTFDFSKYRRNNRGLFKRLQIDNYF